MRYTLTNHTTTEGAVLRKNRDTYIILTSSIDMEGWVTKLQVFDVTNHTVIEVDPSFVNNLEYIGNHGFLDKLIKDSKKLTHEHRLIKNGMGERIPLLNAYRDLEKDQKLLVKELESGVSTPTDYYKKLWLLTDKMVREYLFMED